MLVPFQPIVVRGLSSDANATANRLLAKLEAKLTRNLVRKNVYEHKHAAAFVANVLPPQYKNLGVTLGWGSQSVDLLSQRCSLEGFTWADGDISSLGVNEVWDGNMLGSEISQGTDASLIYSTAFVVTTRGAFGEPDVLWQIFDATKATGDWDARVRKLTSLLVLTGYDGESQLNQFVLYVPNWVLTCSRENGAWRVVEAQEHSWGVPADPLPYKPRIGRPFGQSRISRPMIGLQSQAVRELLRLEGHMDVYSWPEFWMLGADPSIFESGDGLVQTSWKTMLGRIKGVPDDPESTDPQTARADVKQFPASSPEPHLAALNAFAKLYARAASLPDSSLAITDFANPTSAESYNASQFDLIALAERSTDGWSPYLRRSMIRSLGMANGIKGENEIPKEWLSINTKWRDPQHISRAAAADAGVKQLSGIPWLAETEVGLELLGLTEDQKNRALGERRRAESRLMMSRLAAVSTPETPAAE